MHIFRRECTYPVRGVSNINYLQTLWACAPFLRQLPARQDFYPALPHRVYFDHSMRSLPPAASLCVPPTPRRARRWGSFALTLAILSSPLFAGPAENAVEVDRLIEQGAAGKKPILWYARDAEHNRGSGQPGWTATSGGRLSARGADAWGRPDAAFGLAPGAGGGAAVSGSKAVAPINTATGTVLLFCRPSLNSKPPMLLFTNADWGQAGYFSLRINEVKGRWELTLATADPTASNHATQASFATMTPGAWSFIAISWQESGDRCTFRYWAGSLNDKELTVGDVETSAIVAAKPMFLLAGRRADQSGGAGLPNLAFEGGLFSNFAIYDTALSEDTIQRIYLVASRP